MVAAMVAALVFSMNEGQTMKFTSIAISLFVGAVLTASAWAQTGPGPNGPGMQGQGMQGQGMQGQGMQGQGMGGKGGGFAFSQRNTLGWSLMTPEERTAHQQKMRSAKSYDECKSIQAEHHQLMAQRAKDQGKTLPAPRANACDRMKAKGFFAQ